MQLEVIIGFVIICGITYWANLIDHNAPVSRWFRLALFALIGMTIWVGISLLLIGITASGLDQGWVEPTSDLSAMPSISLFTALSFAVICFALASISFYVVVSKQARVFIAEKMFRPIAPTNQYNPNSPIHTLAIVLVLFMTANMLGNFVLLGGLEGIAEEIQNSDINFFTLATNFLMYVLIALLGIGLFIRRSALAALKRLGLTLPQWRDMAWGLGGGIVLFLMQISLVMLWSLVVSPETLAEQSAATNEIFAAFSGSLFMGFLLALFSSIGEEVLFRGALQPIFGIFWTSLFFVMLHAQYTFTPASAIIFLVALGFAWLRQRRNTTTAIIAHFIYNFIPFLAFWVVSLIPTGA